jgi:hypothetical protein
MPKARRCEPWRAFMSMSAPPKPGSAPRLHIWVQAKQVRWIVLGLEFDQALVIAPKRRSDQLSAFVPEKIHQIPVA